MMKRIRRSKRPMIRHLFAVLCGAACIFLVWSWQSKNQRSAAEDHQSRSIRSLPPRPASTAKAATDGTSAGGISVAGTSAADSDGEVRRLVLGTWEDDYHGHRTLTLNEDGTATMIVEPNGIGATLFAKRLHFDIAWSVKDGILSLKTLGGTPANKIALISKLYGDQADEEILELTEERFLVRHSEETDFDWRRVKRPEK